MESVTIKFTGKQEKKAKKIFLEWWHEIGQYNTTNNTLWSEMHAAGFNPDEFDQEVIGDTVNINLDGGE
ncbi:hypothetical protein KAR91_07135 [Candidatus Pacearchaeota archaeon]|nr:hypothetical protein [Candidatus Pacearchaeota archaeon]